MVLLKTLRVGNIDTWTSYEQFVKRGLSPAFNYIDNLGDRLDSLRRRLQAVTEGIQTSALVAQASATRENTMELRKIAEAAPAVKWAAITGIFTVAYYALRIVKDILSGLGVDVATGLAIVVGTFMLGVSLLRLGRKRR
jgi:uncharacterized membrane-anchored protein